MRAASAGFELAEIQNDINRFVLFGKFRKMAFAKPKNRNIFNSGHYCSWRLATVFNVVFIPACDSSLIIFILLILVVNGSANPASVPCIRFHRSSSFRNCRRTVSPLSSVARPPLAMCSTNKL
jgi:hypothetical protein